MESFTDSLPILSPGKSGEFHFSNFNLPPVKEKYFNYLQIHARANSTKTRFPSPQYS